jgi:hypothetical protein
MRDTPEAWALSAAIQVSFFLWRYRPNLGHGLLPWNSPFHFGFLDLRHSVGLPGRVISSSQGLYLYTYTHKHQTSMNWVRFEPMTPGSERAKTVHALDLSATVTGTSVISICNLHSIPIILYGLRFFMKKNDLMLLMGNNGIEPTRRNINLSALGPKMHVIQR